MKESRLHCTLALAIAGASAIAAALLPLLAGAGTHRTPARPPGPVVSVQQLNEVAATQLRASGIQPVLEGRAGLIQQVQIELSNRGYEPGEADGYAGDATRAAVRQFQRDAGLEINGKVDADLLAQLQRRAFVGRPFFSMVFGRSPSLLGNAQLALSRAGYYRGPIDGILNPATREAIRNYRTAPYEQFYVDGYPREYPYLSPAATARLPDQPLEAPSVTDTTPGLAAYRAEDFALAIEQASAVVRALDTAQPDRMAAFFVRGLAWLQLADNEAAVRDFTSVLRLSPDNAAAYFNRAIAYERAALLELARRDFRRASDLGLPAESLPPSVAQTQ